MFPAMRKDSPALADRWRGAARETVEEAQRRSFLRVVSHELRTPLNSILGFSEILASELYGPLGADQYREYAELIRNSGERLLRLVNQVMEIARLEAGDVEVELRAEPLAPILESLCDGLHDTLAARRLRLSLSPCGDVEVFTDARSLRLVLAHLLQNAIAFSPIGGEVRVHLHICQDWTEISVANDGEGVDEGELQRLVRPFEQAENALTRQGGGAGLGLAICHLTCRAIGAQLRLSSQPGCGFNATVICPLG